VRVDPSNRMVVLITRGNGPTSTKPEDPGALKVFGYKDGVLSNRASIAPGGGYNFQPRHLEFHPALPFVFITLERQNKLQVYRKLDGSALGTAPLFTKATLADPARLAGQAASTIHAHPNGRFLYLANRGSDTIDYQGQQILGGGENSIAVYSIQQETGEPALIQSADTRGVHPRTFAIDPSGRILVVANTQQVLVRDGDKVRPLPATLSVFRIGGDGRLEFVRKYDQDTTRGEACSGLGWWRCRNRRQSHHRSSLSQVSLLRPRRKCQVSLGRSARNCRLDDVSTCHRGLTHRVGVLPHARTFHIDDLPRCPVWPTGWETEY